MLALYQLYILNFAFLLLYSLQGVVARSGNFSLIILLSLSQYPFNIQKNKYIHTTPFSPLQKQPQKLRYIVGVILAEGAGAKVLPEHKQLLEEKGYQFATFPAIDHAVQTTFPFNSTISIIMAVMKVYPALREYIGVCVCVCE